MSWFWYVARPDELMVDCDSNTLLQLSLKRLERIKKITERAFVCASTNQDHYHIVVQLKKPMPAVERQVWQLYLMDHIWRSVNNLFRAIEKNPAPSLLISPKRWPEPFWREPDGECSCERKHKGPKLGGCKVGLRLRGGRDAKRNLFLVVK